MKTELKNYAENNEKCLKFLNEKVYPRIDDEKIRVILSEVEHILDYIKNSQDEDIQNCSYLRLAKRAKRWMRENQDIATGIVETEKDIEILHKCDHSKLKIVRLLTKNACLREGKLMNHCVGGYNPKESTLYSLRDSNNYPHATIEVSKSGNEVQQVKGKGNGSIHPKYIYALLHFFEKILNLPVRDSEMINLGYIKLNKDEWNFLEDNFSNIKSCTFNNSRYLYIHSKVK